MVVSGVSSVLGGAAFAGGGAGAAAGSAGGGTGWAFTVSGCSALGSLAGAAAGALGFAGCGELAGGAELFAAALARCISCSFTAEGADGKLSCLLWLVSWLEVCVCPTAQGSRRSIPAVKTMALLLILTFHYSRWNAPAGPGNPAIPEAGGGK